ncbi:Cdc6-like AAA superfamily ATPase [Caldalkalibacillus uzonensis]|uniref:Cdc6-like AAA superfamily ATPase n=1 Tax=Caldalkalibacillus uzonensis TaxID=353224 RepID=A0ABU0CS32_9BACI|nr:hypothetical protein [Caldalkalibacillus uzonensis]MDQ0339231.1 Cdc6-like AAA superfamily ATPase [Caldalkalibacillus uzonensis]
MTTREKHYFAHGHTAEGYVSFYPSLIKELKHRYLLNGAPGTGKSWLLRQLGQQALHRGYGVEFIHSALVREEIDGVIIPALQTAVIDATRPHHFDPVYPVVIDQVINLNEGIDAGKLKGQTDKIIDLVDQQEEAFKRAYDHFCQAKQFHLQKEALYAEGFDKSRANEVTNELISRFLSQVKGENGRERHMFFGAATAEGVVHFIDELTEGLHVRVIVKGRPGSGKSTMLKKLVQKAEELALETEVYHCGFDPNSLDMIYWPQLKVAIVDGTAPHELEPVRHEDEILDMYALCFSKDIDQLYAKELAELDHKYKAQTKQGVAWLREAKQYRDELRSHYQQVMDEEFVQQKLEWLVRTIFRDQ